MQKNHQKMLTPTWYIKVNNSESQIIVGSLADTLEEAFTNKTKVTTLSIDDETKTKYGLANCTFNFKLAWMELQCASILDSFDDHNNFAPCKSHFFDHMQIIKLDRKGDYKWEWYNPQLNQWIELTGKDKENLETEYSGKRYGSIVYHCFGDGRSAIVNYKKMVTGCGSGKCMGLHGTSVNSDHMTFKLRRV